MTKKVKYSYKHRKSAFTAKRDNTDIVWGKVYYARVQSPLTEINTKKGLIKIDWPRFEATLAFDDPDQQEYMSDMLGVEVREPTDNIPLPHVKMTRLADMDKDTQNRPVLLDEQGEYFDDATLIGNGSEVAAFVRLSDAKSGDKTYANLVGLQVFNLIEYNPGEKSSSKESTTPAKKTGTTGKKKPF